MKITLDEKTLAKAVISHLRSVGVQSDITNVDFRYTRVPYTVFAEVEISDGLAIKSTKFMKASLVMEAPSDLPEEEPPLQMSLVDPDNLPDEDIPDELPPPDSPAAPLFGGG